VGILSINRNSGETWNKVLVSLLGAGMISDDLIVHFCNRT